jgi:uncharacterized protein DUF4339/TM2 domain-containing protein
VEYYIAAGQQRLGPFTLEQLAQQGLLPDTLAWREGMPQWLPASMIPELLPLLGAAPIPAQDFAPAPSLAYATPAGPIPPQFVPGGTNRVAAGILGILFGQFGVHKFVAGLTTGAVTMLCITLGCVVGAFGIMCIFPPAILLIFGPAVMHIIGVIEGIMYLCCTDEQFYVRYVVEKRQWF